MNTDISYTDLLAPWLKNVRPQLYRLPDNRKLACYGPGNHGHWAQQANTTAASAFAVMAMDPDLDEDLAGMSRDEVLDWALSLIRFTLHTHHSGGARTTDGGTWGHSWISSLCLDRLWHGIEALGDRFPAEDREQLHRVILSESDWLLDHYTIVAGPVENNKPESNIWNGCLLNRTARLLPDAPNASAYLEKGTRFLLNGISIPEDARSSELIGGVPLSEWHVGHNMFSSMGCNHHGYQNVGYMVISLSNIAMMHFSCKAHGWEPPAGLTHHAEELWRVVKACTFDDGRLMRIGGDTRVRYCYCQDYCIPVWLWARDVLGDQDTLRYEAGWRAQIRKEMTANGDGTFLSRRLQPLKNVSPLYFDRLEGDRACTIGMGAYWNRKYGLDREPAPETPPRTLQCWEDEYHGSCLSRGKKRLASWTWRAAEAPQGLMLESGQSAMAEWRYNLSGQVHGVGRLNERTCTWEQAETFDGGFATCGKISIRTSAAVAEGDIETEVAEIDLACVALPDDRTMVVLQRARALNRPYLLEVKGLFLNVANDLFNGGVRRLHDAGGNRELFSCPGETETLPIRGGWLNVDDSLSVIRVYGPELCIHRPAERQVGIAAKGGRIQVRDGGGSLYAEEICCGCDTGTRVPEPGETLFDLAVVIQAGVDKEDTQRFAEQTPPRPLAFRDPDLRGLELCDAEGVKRRITVNFSSREISEEGETHPAKRICIR